MRTKIKHKPYAKLKGKMREKGITCADLSKLLHLSETAVNHKINGRSDFYIREVEKISTTYDIERKFFSE